MHSHGSNMANEALVIGGIANYNSIHNMFISHAKLDNGHFTGSTKINIGIDAVFGNRDLVTEYLHRKHH